MNRAHKIALDPTVEQGISLSRACGVARFTWNWALAEWGRRYAAGEKPTAAGLKAQFNALKRAEFPWVYDSPKGANQQAFANLGVAFKNFFEKRARYPRFKKKGRHDSYYVPNDRLVLDGKRARLPKIGWVRMRESLRLDGKILSATVSKTAGRWFLSISVEMPDAGPIPQGDGVVGVDLGLTSFAVFSTGESIAAPKPLRAALGQLRREQRRVARRQDGSKRKAKAKACVARTHARVANIRNDFLHKLSTRLVRENQAIVLEDLAVGNMLKNRSLARSISDAGWSEFRRQVTYKAPAAGCELLTVDRFYPSSKTCSGCGNSKSDLSLKDRVYRCAACGIELDRDHNAALNLRAAGLAVILARGPGSAGGGIASTAKLPGLKRELGRGRTRSQTRKQEFWAAYGLTE
jgi:putative transposase